jgi:integrase
VVIAIMNYKRKEVGLMIKNKKSLAIVKLATFLSALSVIIVPTGCFFWGTMSLYKRLSKELPVKVTPHMLRHTLASSGINNLKRDVVLAWTF